MIIIKIFLGVDHQGVKIKNELIEFGKNNEIEIISTVLENDDTDDYPDFAYEVCMNVLKYNALGVLICGSGIGMSIAANKIKGIRCARVCSNADAYTSKNHNGANVIAFSANLPIDEIKEIILTFANTSFPTEDRHLKRIEKINKIERGEYEL